MSLHDAYARLTPFEIAFPDRGRLARLAEAATDEAYARGVDPSSLDGFVGLAAVGQFLAELHGEAPRASLVEYGSLVFHAVHFLREGTPLFLLERGAARSLVESAPGAAPSPPARAGYLQLPQHLFWTRIEGTSPESVDGIFWTVSSDDRLHVLPVTGVRPDRLGFGTLAVPYAPLAHAADWVAAHMRESSDDFASDLPGAQLDRLYAITAAGEILKLMARFFARAAESPGAPEGPANASTGSGPRPSALAYTRVRPGE
jgi:hypothetical protein